MQTNSVFDFLQEIVSKVPDIGTETACEERTSGRRRCVIFFVPILQLQLNRGLRCNYFTILCCIRSSWKWMIPWCQKIYFSVA